MQKVSAVEIVLFILGAVAAWAAWPIGDSVGSVGKMVITFGAVGALGVSIASLILSHKGLDNIIIHMFRNEVALFISFGICAIIVMALTV